MSYIDCPRCHATFHTGPIYEPLDSCPRCGQPFYEPRPARRAHARGSFSHRRAAAEPPDWEAITGSQYTRRRVTPPTDEAGAPPPAA
jgi:hypothetical protein